MTDRKTWKATDLTSWAAGNDISIADGCLDARDIIFKLPENVKRCYACGGNGKYRQKYCDAGRMTGRCDSCGGMGFQYSITSRGVSESVVNQIATTNNLNVEFFGFYGLDWRRNDDETDTSAVVCVNSSEGN